MAKETKPLDEKLIEDLIDDIIQKQDYYIYNSRGSDYSCLYCFEYKNPDTLRINHKSDCSGDAYLKELRALLLRESKDEATP